MVRRTPKGSGVAIVITVILLGTIFSFGLGMAAYSSAGNLKADKIEDLSAQLQVRALGNYFEDNYVAQSLLYSSWQKSYELALEGGGVSKWEEDSLPSLEDIESNLGDEISRSSYFDNFRGSQCFIDFRDAYSIEFTGVSLGSFSFSADKTDIEAVCSRDGIETKYYINSSREIESFGNRYFDLYSSGHSFAEQLGSELSLRDDPSGIFVGVGVGVDPTISEAMAKGTAKILAETTYRSNFVKDILSSQGNTELGEEVSLNILNLPQIGFPSLMKQLEGFAPEFLQDMNNVRKDLRSGLESAQTQIREISEETDIVSDDVRERIREAVSTETIRSSVKEIKSRIDDLYQKTDILEEISKLREDLKMRADELELSKEELKENIGESSSEKIGEIKRRVVTAILNNLRSGGTSLESLELEENLVKTTSQEIKKAVGEIELDSILADFSEDFKEVVKEILDKYLTSAIEQPLLEYIEEQNFTETVSLEFESSSTKDNIRKEVDLKIIRPIREIVAGFIETKVNKTINETVAQILEVVNSEIEKAFENNDVSLVGDDVLSVVADFLKVESGKQVAKDVAAYVAEFIEKTLKEEISEAVQNQADKYLQRVNQDIGKSLRHVDDIAEDISIKVDGSIREIAEELLNSLKERILDFVDNQIDLIFLKVDDEIGEELIDSEEFKDAILENLGKIESSELGSFGLSNSEHVSFDGPYLEDGNFEVDLDSLDRSIGVALDGLVRQKIDGVFANLDVFEGSTSSLKNGIDGVLDDLEVFDKLQKNLENLKKNTDEVFEEVTVALDGVDSAISQVENLLDLQASVEDTLSKVDDELEKVIEGLSLSQSEAFEFGFFDEEVVISIPTPNFCPVCYVSVAEAKIDPEYLDVRTQIRDEKYVLPVSSGYEHLAFEFIYRYEFEGTKNNPSKSLLPVENFGSPRDTNTS